MQYIRNSCFTCGHAIDILLCLKNNNCARTLKKRLNQFKKHQSVSKLFVRKKKCTDQMSCTRRGRDNI